MLPEYRYQCVDQSVLVPALKRFIVVPLSRITPLAIPANLITIGTNIFMYVGVVLCVQWGAAFRANFFLLPLFMLIYAVGDHLDGLQAKRTGTGSALGEFCDHYLDAFNTGIVVFFALKLFGIEHSLAVPLVFVGVYTANAGVIFEELRTGWLRFEKFGSLEGVALVVVLLLLGAVDSFYRWVNTPLLPLGITPMIAVMLATTAGGVLTLVGVFRRAGVSVRFVTYIALLVALAAYAHFYLNTVQTFLLFVLYGAHYSGALLHAHLVTKHEPWPDPLAPLALWLLALLPPAATTALTGILLPIVLSYLALRNAVVATRTVYALRAFWYWKNPQGA